MGKVRHDFDLAWKEALASYLPDFLALFLPEVHDAIDWAHPPQFLDSETRRLRRSVPGMPKRPRGQRMLVDMVAKVRLLGGQDALVLIHVEVQSQKDPTFEVRMRLYNDRLFDRYGLPVFSVAVLADADPSWRPCSYDKELWGCRSLLEFRVIKLLDWKDRRSELEVSKNPFSLVAAAHLAVLETRPDQSARLQVLLRLVRILKGRGFSQEQVYGLYNILTAIMALSKRLRDTFDREVLRLEERDTVKLTNSFERRGLEKGFQEGHRASIQGVCEARFGEVPEGLDEALEAVSDPKVLKRLVGMAATAASVADLLEEVRREGREA